MTGSVLAIIIGYVLGAIPPGLWLAKKVRGIDIREYGSGNIGATNIMRLLGFRWALVVAFFDLGKGVAAFYIGKGLGDTPWVEATAAMAALVGHCYSIFIGFSGGRGVNTGMGALFAMSPLWAAVALALGIVVVGFFRYVSLGSLVGSVFAFWAMLGLAMTGHEPWAYFAYTAAGVPLILFQHRDNIQRLLTGQERRVGRKGAPAKAVGPAPSPGRGPA